MLTLLRIRTASPQPTCQRLCWIPLVMRALDGRSFDHMSCSQKVQVICWYMHRGSQLLQHWISTEPLEIESPHPIINADICSVQNLTWIVWSSLQDAQGPGPRSQATFLCNPLFMQVFGYSWGSCRPFLQPSHQKLSWICQMQNVIMITFKWTGNSPDACPFCSHHIKNSAGFVQCKMLSW